MRERRSARGLHGQARGGGAAGLADMRAASVYGGRAASGVDWGTPALPPLVAGKPWLLPPEGPGHMQGV